MGIYDRNYYREEQDSSFLSMNRGVSGRSMVLILIGINVAVFLIDAFTQRIRPGATIGQFCSFLALYETDAVQPWYWFRILTAAFAHGSVGHIFSNMIVLFFFGRPIETVYGAKKFLWMYLTAALGANLVWLAVQASDGQLSGPLLGASGATTAVFLLFCIHFPHQKVHLLFFPFFGIPAWIMGVLIIGHDLAGQLGLTQVAPDGPRIAFLVHLAGAAYAYCFYRTRWTLDQILPSALNGKAITNAFRPKPNLRVHRPQSQDRDLEKKADHVLRKLHEQGEASLSANERRILEEYSRKINQRR